MASERYQLVAIDNVTKERYVIELRNSNKNDRGSLGFIDRGVSVFKDQLELAGYLYKKGKIPNLNVSFFIVYNQKGEKNLPLIFNDPYINNVSKRTDNKLSYNDDFVYYTVRCLLAKLSDNEFYQYIRRENKRNQRSAYNGNYVDNKVLDNIIDYYYEYIVPHEIDANSATIQYSLLKEFTQYKQLRTLYYLIKQYDLKQKNQSETYDTISFDEYMTSYYQPQEELGLGIKDFRYNDVKDDYDKDGMDGVYAVYDFDEIYDENGPTLK